MSCWLVCLERPLTRTRAVCMMSMHGWLDVLFHDNCILAGRQRLYLILLCVPMCLYNHCAIKESVKYLLEQNSRGVVCVCL